MTIPSVATGPAPGRPASPPPLGRRPYLAFVGAFAASQHANGLYQVALPLLAIPAGAVAVGVVAAAATAPWLVTAIPAGILADRLDRRRLLLTVCAIRTATAAAIAAMVISGTLSVPVLCVLAFVLGSAEVVHDTTAHSLTPRLVSLSRLAAANSRLQTVEYAANFFVGRGLGGALAAVGAGFGVVLASVVWAVAGVLVRFGLPDRVGHSASRPSVTGPSSQAAPAPPSAGATRPGWRATWSSVATDRTLRVYLVALALANLMLAGFWVALPVAVVGTGHGAGTYGLLLAVAGVAGLGMSLLVPVILTGLGPRRAVLVAGLGIAAGLTSLIALDNLVLLAAGLAATGLMPLINVVSVTTRQRTVPDAVLGRVTSIFRLVTWGALPLGSLLGGFAADRFGTGPLSLLLGVGMAAAAIAVWKVSPHQWKE
jgi:MFS family permease